MTKQQINGIIKRLGTLRAKLLEISSEFGDVDNYLMTEIERSGDRIQENIAQIREAESDLIQTF